jgi:thiamine pyrophosphate-dependent acetolactate synthase large subunit-like protein
MGVGVPFALAACLVQPDRPVLAISGDFALGLNIMDLETAVRFHLPLVMVVANNSGSGGCLKQKRLWPPDYPERVCQFAADTRYDLIMQAMGGVGLLVNHAEQVVPALEKAFGSRRPTLIQVNTRDDVPLPSF